MFTQITKLATETPIKFTLGSIASIIAIVAALFTVDERYAKAADVEKAETQQSKEIQSSITMLRRQMLEDRLFEYDIKKAQSKNGQLSPIDQAIRDRYQQQLNDLIAKQNANQ